MERYITVSRLVMELIKPHIFSDLHLNHKMTSNHVITFKRVTRYPLYCGYYRHTETSQSIFNLTGFYIMDTSTLNGICSNKSTKIKLFSYNNITLSRNWGKLFKNGPGRIYGRLKQIISLQIF